jgi:D-psicose/D-tagatose/L-ribulose 3-epimerase
MVKEIGHPNFKLIFDCRSASGEEKSVNKALIRALDSRALCHIHVNDESGRGPGFGKTKFAPILKTLVKNGYKGYISVEVFQFDPDPQIIASRSIGYVRGIF